jgi:hypothetical protein
MTAICRSPWWVAILLALSICPSAYSQVDDEDELPEFLPGLLAELELPGPASQSSLAPVGSPSRVKRFDPDVQADWSVSAIDLRADVKSPIKIGWSGFLETKQNGLFRIHAYVAGQIRVRLDGKLILTGQAESARWVDSQPMDLKFGRHPLEIEYEGSGSKRQIGLYWSGPQFELEPISHRYFSHRSDLTVDTAFERGMLLSRAFRCVACHDGKDTRDSLAAPALTHLDDNLRREWLVQRLTATSSTPDQRMPHFGLNSADAIAIADTLFAASKPAAAPKKYNTPKAAPQKKKEDPAPRNEPSAEEGRLAFMTLGCLACHQLGELGDKGLFDGGPLDSIAAKRPADFFGRWLDDPASVNSQHRMPEFKLSELQRADLLLFLQALGTATAPAPDNSGHPEREVQRQGKKLIAEHRCGACHHLPEDLKAELVHTAVGKSSDWEGGCLNTSEAARARPGYGLSKADREALRTFWVSVDSSAIENLNGSQLIREMNCLGCHARDEAIGLANTIAKLAEVEPEVAPRSSTLGPPSLSGVGDKLHESAFRDVLTGKSPSRRPWLAVQMPKFRLTEKVIASIVGEVVAHDRIPDLPTTKPELPIDKAVELAAARLVTAEGFGCQSCHKIGSVEPAKVAINALGTNLTMIGERVRPSWFLRWVHNPSRIVPRMEMPAIQVAAKGILNDDLDLQLGALWKTLNTPGFEPPKPNPVRVVRNLNFGADEHANVLTDVLETPRRKYVRPLIVGLSNRHNVLFDLESGRLASWWIGDTARQYTRGKSWYWEPGAPSIVDNLEFLQDFSLVDSSSRAWKAAASGQFVVQFDELRHLPGGVEWRGRVEFQNESRSRLISLAQRVIAVDGSGLEATTYLSDLADGDVVFIEAAPQTIIASTGTSITARLQDFATATWRSTTRMQVQDETRLRMEPDRTAKAVEWTLRLSTTLPSEQLPSLPMQVAPAPTVKLGVVPGFDAVQLPLPRNEMPTAIAWGKAGEMFIASLKGRVLRVSDTDADGLGDTFASISDDLPAPYGLAVNDDSVDVLCKTSLIRLTPVRGTQDLPHNQTVIADGWGYTADYHDWAVGLERDADGCYYLALPCQQDDRSEAAAKLRGQALKLIPYNSQESRRAYRIETLAAGLRFPMGLALSASGDLFATDNQGNYNPFNELNHLQFAKRYGFINRLESKPGFAPDFESPAVNLPHPWTRSVNGLCFLKTPAAQKAKGRENVFGPFEGDLIGCEYNGLSLIRMSLQKVGGQYQGAAYMFSRPPVADEATFEGPVTCAVSPEGELYVGSIHDSGWGGGQNTGSIVRLKRELELPLGIDEVLATPDGLEIRFTQPVDSERATQAANYSVRSYRRISTPAYGGDDQDERNESIRGLKVSADLKTVMLELNELRGGCVYEINVGSVGITEQTLFPSQAHYNMRAVPRN